MLQLGNWPVVTDAVLVCHQGGVFKPHESGYSECEQPLSELQQQQNKGKWNHTVKSIITCYLVMLSEKRCLLLHNISYGLSTSIFLAVTRIRKRGWACHFSLRSATALNECWCWKTKQKLEHEMNKCTACCKVNAIHLNSRKLSLGNNCMLTAQTSSLHLQYNWMRFTWGLILIMCHHWGVGVPWRGAEGTGAAPCAPRPNTGCVNARETGTRAAVVVW